MKTRVILLMIMLLLLICNVASAQFGLTQVRITVEEEKRLLLGTGCLIGDKLLLTCHHCVAGNDFQVTYGEQVIKGKCIASDEEADVALVLLESNPKGVRSVSVGVAHLNESVTIGGFGGSQENWKYQKGKLSSRGLSRKGGLTSAVTGVEPRHGDSGGPVLDSNGRLVGIVWAVVEPDEEDSYALVHEFLPFLVEHAPNQKYWKSIAEVDPYITVKMKHLHWAYMGQWEAREHELEEFIQKNALPVPARPEFWLE